MSMTIDDLQTLMNREAPSGARKRFRALFEDGSRSSFVVKPVRAKADETLRLWETRLKTSRLPPGSLRGIRSLVERLRTMRPGAEIEQFGFTGTRFAGSVFFDRASGEFLGDTIVERRAKSRQMLDLEAQLFRSSRKSA
jgi:hypothetical protein